jgi:hypothetical protein
MADAPAASRRWRSAPVRLLFGASCVGTQTLMRYTRYVAVLKWAMLSLFAYFGAVLMVEVPPGARSR